jgi:DNA polymerase III delta prime subunit
MDEECYNKQKRSREDESAEPGSDDAVAAARARLGQMAMELDEVIARTDDVIQARPGLALLYRVGQSPDWRLIYDPNTNGVLSFRALLERLHSDQAPLEAFQAVRVFKPEFNGFERVRPSTKIGVTGDVVKVLLTDDCKDDDVKAFVREKRSGLGIQVKSSTGGIVEPDALDLVFLAVHVTHGDTVARQVVDALLPLLWSDWRKHRPGGILFHGPPGTGKSRICNAILRVLAPSGSSSVLFRGVAAQLNEKYVGETERKLREMADTAAAKPDQLFFIFLDEIHGLAKKQERAQNATADHKLDSLLTLLEVMSDQPHSNIIMLFATNFKSALDRAFSRSKRVDVEIPVLAHTRKQRTEWLEKHYELLAPRWSARESEAAVVEQQKLFPVLTANFVGAQFEALASRLTPGDVPPGVGDALRELLTERSSRNVWDCVLEVAERSDLTRPLRELFLPALRSGHQPLDHQLLQWLIAVDRQAQIDEQSLTGHISLLGASGLLGVEGPTHADPMKFFRLEGNTAEHRTQELRTLLLWKQPDHVYWVDARLRNDHSENLDEVLEEIRQMCHRVACPMVIVEMDELIGLVPHSVSLQTGQSSSTTMGAGTSTSISMATAFSWNTSTAKQTGTSTSVSAGSNYGIGDQLSKTTTDGKNWGESVNSNWSASHAKNSSVTNTLGGSLSGGFSTKGGWNVNAGVSYSRAWTTGDTWTTGTGGGDSQSTGGSWSIAEGVVKSQNLGWSHQDQAGTTDSIANTLGEGGSRTWTAGETVQLNSSLATGETRSQTVTWQIQYPKALAAITAFLNKTNRALNPLDPFVVTVWRSFSPNLIQGLDTVEHVPMISVLDGNGRTIGERRFLPSATIKSLLDSFNVKSITLYCNGKDLSEFGLSQTLGHIAQDLRASHFKLTTQPVVAVVNKSGKVLLAVPITRNMCVQNLLSRLDVGTQLYCWETLLNAGKLIATIRGLRERRFILTTFPCAQLETHQ